MRLRHFAVLIGIMLAGPALAQSATPTDFDQGVAAYKASEKASGAERERLKAESLRLFEQGCAKNDARSCEKIATEGYLTSLYREGRGAKRSAAAHKAAAIYNRACAMGPEAHDAQFRSCISLAHLVRAVRNGDTYYPAADRTDGLPQYVARAGDIFAYNCSLDFEKFGLECMGASQMLSASDPKRAGELHKILCDGDQDWACHKIGRLSSTEREMLKQGGAKCDKKDGAACFAVGIYWYQNLKTMPGSGEQIRAALKKGCAADHAKSCGALGGLLATGDGGPANVPEAVTYMEKGCRLSGDEKSVECRNAAKVRAAVTKSAG